MNLEVFTLPNKAVFSFLAVFSLSLLIPIPGDCGMNEDDPTARALTEATNSAAKTPSVAPGSAPQVVLPDMSSTLNRIGGGTALSMPFANFSTTRQPTDKDSSTSRPPTDKDK